MMSVKKILKALKDNKSFLISTHISPDPDALSSELILAAYLKSIGKRVFIVNEEEIPERFLFMPYAKWVKKYDPRKKPDYDCAIIVDCGELSRVGRVAEMIDTNKELINIDHHITNDKFGRLNLIAPKASSTAEVLYDLLITKNRVKLNRNLAALIYLGIMTDTGSFRYENTAPHTHQVASELLKYNINPPELYKIVYESVPLNDIASFTKVVSNFDALDKGRIILVTLRKNVVAKFSQDFDLRDKIFRFLRTTKGVEVLVILTEHKKNLTRINLRSQGKVDVAKLASYFGGGGHKKASGCMIDGALPQARTKLLRQLRKELK